MKFIDLKNKKFGKWTVIEYCGKSKWKCICECGNVKEVISSTLRNGTSTNCGCKKIKHGYDGTKIYRLWCHIRERCYSNKNKNYKNYGGRGIKVCKEWEEAINFIEWALRNGYKEDLTIDRIDVNGNYEPSNCRFITMREQQNNKRNSRYIEINGIKKTVSEWAEITNLDRHTILYRLNKGEKGLETIRKTKKGGGFNGADFKEYFNKIGKNRKS